MKILLARHGETAWNAEGRYQGQTDVPLSPLGVTQARALGRRLARVRLERAVTSPLARAEQTACLALGESRASMLRLDPGLMEIAHGQWEGLSADEIRARDRQRWLAWREAPETVRMPGGESLQQVFERAWPALGRALDGLEDDATVLVVAHDAVNRLLLCRILGIGFSRLWGFQQAPTTLNLLRGPALEHLQVVRLNDCTHHWPLFGEAVHRAL